ncbi:phospholipase/carboxylesterase family protein [Xylariaceae sp. FL0255]|nr:phospholipase/carboxylesterase family protein [Xylariaceae sp. FL0255]
MVLRCVSLPAYTSHSHTVIFLHGRGSTAREFSEELWELRDRRGESLQHIFPSVKWVFAQADQSYTERFKEHIPQWFDIWGYDDPDERRELQIPGLREVVPKVIRLIQTEASGIGLQNIVLAGLSQGCATAIHALLNYPKSETRDDTQRLCAFIGLSSWMSLGAATLKESRELLRLEYGVPNDDVYKDTPIFIGHCADDPMVSIDQGKRLRDLLTTFGATVTWKEYLGGGHEINMPDGIEDIVAFLKAQGLQAT